MSILSPRFEPNLKCVHRAARSFFAFPGIDLIQQTRRIFPLRDRVGAFFSCRPVVDDYGVSLSDEDRLRVQNRTESRRAGRK
jgi:hypothetical protein